MGTRRRTHPPPLVYGGLTNVNHNSPEHCNLRMEMEQWIAIFFTVLMVGSVVAMGATLL